MKEETHTPNWRMPAEWHPHAGTWLSWPHNQETWPYNLKEAQDEFRRLVNVIAETDGHAYVCLAGDQMAREFSRTEIPLQSKTILCQIPTNDAWARDYAPTFVITEQQSDRRPTSQPLPWFPSDSTNLGAVDWRYNAWGGKYPPFDLDQNVARLVAQETQTQLMPSKLCVEGGALEVNNKGILLTTRSCVLNPNRNPNWSISEVESELKIKLGVENIIWLAGDAITGDDTDGHIDQLARFVNDTKIVYAWTDDPHDPQSPNLKQNLADLKQGLEQLGLDYELVPLLLPREELTFRGQRIPGSYCNFCLTNEAVIVPQFDDAHDQLALDVLSEHFPNRDIIGLPSRNLSVGLGSFHCLTQQMPKP